MLAVPNAASDFHANHITYLRRKRQLHLLDVNESHIWNENILTPPPHTHTLTVVDSVAAANCGVDADAVHSADAIVVAVVNGVSDTVYSADVVAVAAVVFVVVVDADMTNAFQSKKFQAFRSDICFSFSIRPASSI